MTASRSALAALLLDALDDLERSLEGLDAPEAENRLPGFSSISWTTAHVARTIDFWVISGIPGWVRNSYLASNEFGFGGTGEGVAWDAVCRALSEVLGKTRSFLETVGEDNLARESIYQGNIYGLKGKIIKQGYWLARAVAHIYYHIGEITTVRAAMGHKVAGFPGTLTATLAIKRKG